MPKVSNGVDGEHEARALEQLAQPRLAGEGQPVAEAPERFKRRHRLEDVAERARDESRESR